MKRNRVGIALSAVGIHASIGSVYAWSVLTKPVMAEMGISLSSTTWAFSIAILFLGLSAAFLGKFVERIGPRASGLLSMLFFCSGLIGTALAVSMRASRSSISFTVLSAALGSASAISRRFQL